MSVLHIISQMKKQALLVIEIIWFCTGILCIVAGIRSLLRTGGSQFVIFLIMAVVSFVFALARHKQRKNG